MKVAVKLPAKRAKRGQIIGAAQAASNSAIVKDARVRAGMFEDLNKGRAANKLADMRYAVVRIKKDGKPSKVDTAGWRPGPGSTLFIDEDDAKKFVPEMEKMNPGSKFTVVKM